VRASQRVEECSFDGVYSSLADKVVIKGKASTYNFPPKGVLMISNFIVEEHAAS
jgi:hypothetical protein